MTEPLVITLGCRLNAYESQVMREHATAAGLDNAIIVNTCAVTAEAVRQATQTVRRLRREHPQARLIVTGCAAQVEPERFARPGRGRSRHRQHREDAGGDVPRARAATRSRAWWSTTS